MKEVHLTITEEVDETGLTEMQIKERGRQQFELRIRHAFNHDLYESPPFETSNLRKLINQMSWSIQAEPELTWAEEVEKDAKDYIKENLLDATIEAIIGYDHIDDVFQWHLNHSKTWYETEEPNLQVSEAVNLITNLHSFEADIEDLNGSPEELLCIKAKETYKNALYAEIESMMSDIDACIDIEDIELRTYQELLTKEDDENMEDQGVDLSDELAMLEWAKENKENWDKKLEEKVKQAVLDCLA